MEKICIDCSVKKDSAAFYNNYKHCKKCHLKKTNAYRDTHRSALNAKRRECYARSSIEDRRVYWRKHYDTRLRAKRKFNSLHREQLATDARQYRQANPEKFALTNQKNNIKQRCKRFGITVEQYNEMFEAQNHLCAVCKNPETDMQKGKVIRLAVDHNHKTNQLRELLCGKCNKMIGLCYEDISILESLINYIKKHNIC